MIYMQKMLTEQVPRHHQRAVLTAVTTKRTLVRQWAQDMQGCDEDDGCPDVIAAYSMVGKPIDAREVYSHGGRIKGHAGIERFLSTMAEGLTPDMLGRAWRSWDMATDDEREECIEACRQQLASLPAEDPDYDVVPTTLTADIRASIMARYSSIVSVSAPALALMFISMVMA